MRKNCALRARFFENTSSIYMKIKSKDFKDNGFMPKKFTCDGQNSSPEIDIFAVPNTAKSLLIIAHDHDAEGSDFVHWLIWNIDPRCEVIHENMTPVGALEGINDFGETGWKGPCPPHGTHRYEFHLYALDTLLDLPYNSDKEAVRVTMDGHVIDETSLVGLYPERK